ncbi:MAG: condensation domain-containing protein, partial [Acidobacteria bacterium]|nr:condensation domain-containing protein [Acidobacteriota bacterium]
MGADTIAFLQYTSGSTTTPKGVVITHRNLLHNQRLIQQAFGQSAQSVILSWLPFYHDMGLIGGVLQPLFLGAKCILMSPTAFLQRPLRWLEAISAYRATTSGGPNFAYDLCVDKTTTEERAALDLSSWSVAFNGAEPVRAETLSRFMAAFEPCGFRHEAFYPCYGLAEATLLVSGGHAGNAPTIKNVAADALVANRAASATTSGTRRDIVGSGLLPPQQKVVIADPHEATICAPGEVGEIWVSGQSVAKGYWRAREETDAFKAYISNTGEGPFLRTGDLGFIENGELFVTGRLKDLIIIRGVNYYPQDIELTVEQSHVALRKGAGAAFSVEAGGQERLVVVQELDVRAKLDADEVIDAIRRAVTEAHELQIYAVALIRLNSIPKTTSGKIQRYACREGFLNDGLKMVACDKEAEGLTTAPEKIELVSPATTARDVESFLISHIAARLKVDPHTIRTSDPITRYGFDSLMSIELTHEVEKALGIVIPMTCFLGSPTIADIAAQAIAQLTEALPHASATLAPTPDTNEYHPLSYGQQALWFLHQLEPTSPAYNITCALRIVSGIDLHAIRRALQSLIDRHPMLRATFNVQEGKPIQFIHQNVQVYLLEDDAESWSTAHLNERLTELAALPFNLEQGPLFRVYLFTRSPQEHVLLLVVHHLVADFWSLEVLLHELSLLYSAEIDNATVQLPALPLRYTDYVRWQTGMLAGEEGERLWNYWQQQLGADLPPLDLPLDKPRPPVQSFRGASESLVLDESLLRSLKALARTGETTLFAVLLTAFQLFLHRYTGQEQIIVGSPTSGRSRAELANIAGYFVNPVAIKSDFKESRDFRELLALNRKTLLGAYQHEEYPFALLVERLQPTRHPGRSPLFQVMFVLQKAHLRDRQELAALALGETGVRVKLGELELETIALQQQTVQFDLTLLAAEIGEGLVLSMQYNIDLFESTTIRRALANYQTLLEGIVGNPQQRLSDLPIVSAAEREEMVKVWNDTGEPFPSSSCLHHLFESQARLTPHATALRW